MLQNPSDRGLPGAKCISWIIRRQKHAKFVFSQNTQYNETTHAFVMISFVENWAAQMAGPGVCLTQYGFLGHGDVAGCTTLL